MNIVKAIIAAGEGMATDGAPVGEDLAADESREALEEVTA
jgi:hypothetical protein